MRRIYHITAIISFFILALCSLAFAADETITITTYYPSPSGSYNELRANRMAVGVGTTMPSIIGSLAWGDGVSVLQPDQGGSIELGGLYGGNPSTPYIDFHRDNTAFPAGDYDARIILSDANTLEIMGARVKAENIPGCVRVAYTATSGNCPCGDWNCDGDTLDTVGSIKEAATYYLTFMPNGTYPQSGTYLCCEAQ